MVEITQWEYRVESIGSFWRGTNDDEFEAILDEWGEEGWEVISAQKPYGSNKTTVIAKRPSTPTTRRQRNMPRYG